jgi:hypothetical protein
MEPKDLLLCSQEPASGPYLRLSLSYFNTKFNENVQMEQTHFNLYHLGVGDFKSRRTMGLEA